MNIILLIISLVLIISAFNASYGGGSKRMIISLCLFLYVCYNEQEKENIKKEQELRQIIREELKSK